MANFKCTNSFTAEKDGKRHGYGDKISSSDYDKLTSREQSYYRREEDVDYASRIANGDYLGTGLIGGLDGNMGTLL